MHLSADYKPLTRFITVLVLFVVTIGSIAFMQAQIINQLIETVSDLSKQVLEINEVIDGAGLRNGA